MERDSTTNEILLTRNEFDMCLNGLSEAERNKRLLDSERYANIVSFMNEVGLDFEEGDRLPGRDGKIALNQHMANCLMIEVSTNVDVFTEVLTETSNPARVARVRHELINQHELLNELQNLCELEHAGTQDVSAISQMSSVDSR